MPVTPEQIGFRAAQANTRNIGQDRSASREHTWLRSYCKHEPLQSTQRSPSYLADIHPYSSVFDQFRLWRVVEVEHIGDNPFIQQHHESRLSEPVISISPSVGLVCIQGHHVEESVLVFGQTLWNRKPQLEERTEVFNPWPP